MAAAQISSSLCCYSSVRETSASNAGKTARLPRKFATGSSLCQNFNWRDFVIEKPFYRRNCVYKSKSVPIRCEQSSKGVDVWLWGVAMVGFASGITVEMATGKGLLENFGVPTPLPTVALAVTLLVGLLTAVFIFQSASEN